MDGKRYQANTNQKKARVVIVISDRADLIAKMLHNEKDAHSPRRQQFLMCMPTEGNEENCNPVGSEQLWAMQYPMY